MYKRCSKSASQFEGVTAMPKRLSVPLDDDMENALNELADRRTSLAKIAERMMRNGIGLEALRIRGGEIIYRDPDGKEKLLADETMSFDYRLPRLGKK